MFEISWLLETWITPPNCMKPLYLLFMYLFFGCHLYISVPLCFLCLGECRDPVLLWRSFCFFHPSFNQHGGGSWTIPSTCSGTMWLVLVSEWETQRKNPCLLERGIPVFIKFLKTEFVKFGRKKESVDQRVASASTSVDRLTNIRCRANKCRECKEVQIILLTQKVHYKLQKCRKESL